MPLLVLAFLLICQGAQAQELPVLVNPRTTQIPATFPPEPIILRESATQQECARAQVERELRESRSLYEINQIRFFANPEPFVYAFIAQDAFRGIEYYIQVVSLSTRMADQRGEAVASYCSLVAHHLFPVFLVTETANLLQGPLSRGRIVLERYPSNY